MSFVFDNISFNQIILHNVYPPNDDGIVSPHLSKKLIKLDGAAELKLQERISKVLGHDSQSLEMLIEQTEVTSCFHQACQLIKASDSDFITISAEIAHLHTKAHTNKSWPGGSLVIISGTVGVSNKRCLFIVKAEPQSGFKEDKAPEQIQLEYIDNLILTPQSRLYKVGVFIEEDAKNESDYLAYIFDSNIKSQDDSKAAQYFYSNFLGLRIPENAQQKTRDFYTFSKDFINSSDLPGDEKLDLQQALYTYLKTDQRNTIQVSDFADSYLKDDLKDDYMDYMENKKFPTTAVIKDLKLIQKKLKQRKINFSSNVKISAPADTFNDLIEIIEVHDESTTINIKGHLTKQD